MMIHAKDYSVQQWSCWAWRWPKVWWSHLRASVGAFECLDAARGGLRRRERIEEDLQAVSTDRSWRCRWGAFWMGLVVGGWSKRRKLSWPASPEHQSPPPRLALENSARRRHLRLKNGVEPFTAQREILPIFWTAGLETYKTRPPLGCVMGGFNSDLSSRSGESGQSFVRKSLYTTTNASTSNHGHYSSKKHDHGDPNTKPGHPTRKDTNHHTQSITRQSSSPCHHPQAAITVEKKEGSACFCPPKRKEHKKALPAGGRPTRTKKVKG